MKEEQTINGSKELDYKKLGEVCRIAYGKGLPTKDLKAEGYPVFGANGIIGFNDKYLYEEPEVLISCRGAYSGRINFSPPKCFVTNNSLILEIKDQSLLNKKFLFHILHSVNKSKLVTGTAQPQVTINNAVDLSFPLPPLETQQQIVSKIEELFSELDKGIEELKTAQQQLKVYRQAVLKWAFEGKLTEEWRSQQSNLTSSKELREEIRSEQQEQFIISGKKLKPVPELNVGESEELGKLPDGWIWCRLGELVWSVKDGPHYSPKYQNEGIPFISGGNIKSEGINFSKAKFISKELHEELSLRCKPELNDVLYTKGGTTGIARVNTYPIDFNVWVHVAVLKLIKSTLPFYLQHVLNSNHCYKQSQKYTHGVGNQDLGLTRMVLITLPMCSPAEQQQIVQEIECRLSVCDKIDEAITASLKQAEALRQSILKKAFEGKLV